MDDEPRQAEFTREEMQALRERARWWLWNRPGDMRWFQKLLDAADDMDAYLARREEQIRSRRMVE